MKICCQNICCIYSFFHEFQKSLEEYISLIRAVCACKAELVLPPVFVLKAQRKCVLADQVETNQAAAPSTQAFRFVILEYEQ